MNVLLVGGAGYIGRHLNKLFSENGATVRTIDLMHGQDIRYVDQGMLPKLRVDVLVHLAHLKSVRESVSDPGKYFDHNISTTLAVQRIVQQYSIPHVVFSSSATVYAPANMPLTEQALVAPTTPYGWTKYISEQMLLQSCPSVCVLRYFNPVFGAQGLEETQAVPENLDPAIKKSLQEGYPLKVYGSDYATPDGTAVRDYIDVERLAKAHLYALEHRGHDIVNIGTGVGTSVLQFIQMYEERYNVKVPYEFAERRPGDIPSLVACTEKSKQLGWNY